MFSFALAIGWQCLQVCICNLICHTASCDSDCKYIIIPRSRYTTLVELRRKRCLDPIDNGPQTLCPTHSQEKCHKVHLEDINAVQSVSQKITVFLVDFLTFLFRSEDGEPKSSW